MCGLKFIMGYNLAFCGGYCFEITLMIRKFHEISIATLTVYVIRLYK